MARGQDEQKEREREEQMTDDFRGQRGEVRRARDPRDVQEEHEAMIERDLDPDFALISDYACGELDAEGAARVRERLNSDPDFRELAEPVLLAWSVPPKTKPLSQQELLRAWLQVRRRAGMPAVPGQDDLDEREELGKYYERQRRVRARESRSHFLKVASIFIVLMAIPVFTFWWEERTSNVTRASSEWQVSTEALLPDGSRATLSSASKISYARGFARGRAVNLVGEARFDVVPGSSFTVTTESAQLWVTGTSFTVTAYSGAATIVTVHEGSVSVAARRDDGAARTSAKVGAGQRVRVVRNGAPEFVP
jgi:hypothetical protein